jgi:hypothetical protein
MAAPQRKKRPPRRAGDPVASDPARKLRLACELFDLGVAIMTENLRRRHPGISRAALREKVKRWIQTRPGAELGDCPGRLTKLKPPERGR